LGAWGKMGDTGVSGFAPSFRADGTVRDLIFTSLFPSNNCFIPLPPATVQLRDDKNGNRSATSTSAICRGNFNKVIEHDRRILAILFLFASSFSALAAQNRD